MDHVPIIIFLDLSIAKAADFPIYNWQAIDWGTYKEKLAEG